MILNFEWHLQNKIFQLQYQNPSHLLFLGLLTIAVMIISISIFIQFYFIYFVKFLNFIASGVAIVTESKAAMWTDGRYFLQAAEQMDENWTLMKIGEFFLIN